MQSQGIKIDIAAQIVGYQKSLEKLKQMAKNIDLGSALGKNISSAIKSAEKDLAALQKNPIQTAKSQGQIEGVVNKANKVGQAIQNIGTMMQSITGDSLNLQALGAEFTKLASNIDILQGKLNQAKNTGFQEAVKDSEALKAAFDVLGVSVDKITTKKAGDALAAGLTKAKSEAEGLKSKLDEATAAQQRQQAAVNKIKDNPLMQENFNLDNYFDKIRNVALPQRILNPEKIQQLKNQMIDELSNLKIDASKQGDVINILDTLFSNFNIDNASTKLKTFFSQLSTLTGEKVNELRANLIGEKKDSTLISSLIGFDPESIRQTRQQYTTMINQIASGLNSKDLGRILGSIQNINTSRDAESTRQLMINTVSTANVNIANEYEQQNNKLQELIARRKQLVQQSQTANQKLTTINAASTEYNSIIENLNNKLAAQEKQIASLKQQLSQMKQQAAHDIRKESGGVVNSAGAFYISTEAAAKYKTQLADIQSKQQMLGKLQGVVQRWFSIYTVVRAVGNAIRSVISTIKQLDKTITEIAIVTDMSQNDLWGQMDKYTDLATKYAASISGVYKVSQLYYQQGLQTTDVMALTEQTLKMSRISGLDYQAATNYMTNAVRSFKMQMTDAQQVVDAYSAVAANSATSVSELATAMSKTASSAQAVGSSFQNTTAMMAVMIEATRESAENIGSAMKSIISRYGEMTSDPSLTKDSEGQEMSLNRVDKALQSVGITLQTTEGQFRNFDEVIMELAQKWDTIDTNTQRYIATIMA